MVLPVFEEAHEQAKRNIDTAISQVMDMAAMKSFFTAGADEVLDVKMCKLAKSHEFTLVLVRHRINYSNFTITVAHMLK